MILSIKSSLKQNKTPIKTAYFGGLKPVGFYSQLPTHHSQAAINSHALAALPRCSADPVPGEAGPLRRGLAFLRPEPSLRRHLLGRALITQAPDFWR